MAFAIGLSLALPLYAQEEEYEEQKVQIAYVEHDTKGGWGRQWQYYSGSNMRQFLRQLQRQTNIHVDPTPGEVSFNDKDQNKLFDYPILFMTSNHAAQLRDEEIANMREYLLRGGFILADDCVKNGTFSRDKPPEFTRAFIEVMRRVFPERRFETIPHDHPIYHCFYKFDNGLPRFHPDGQWEGLGIFDGDRLMVLLSPNDICCGWQFSWGQLSKNAFSMGINIFVYALTH
jgi:hypothetical protein